MGLAAEAALIRMRDDELRYNPEVLAALGRVHAEAETDAVAEEWIASETVSSEHQLFRPIAEQVLRALRA
jgi:hypothetical protein